MRPPFSWTSPIPDAAAARRARSMSARRWAGVMAALNASRATWCASLVTRPSPIQPGCCCAPEAAASADEITAECPSTLGM